MHTSAASQPPENTKSVEISQASENNIFSLQPMNTYAHVLSGKFGVCDVLQIDSSKNAQQRALSKVSNYALRRSTSLPQIDEDDLGYCRGAHWKKPTTRVRECH